MKIYPSIASLKFVNLNKTWKLLRLGEERPVGIVVMDGEIKISHGEFTSNVGIGETVTLPPRPDGNPTSAILSCCGQETTYYYDKIMTAEAVTTPSEVLCISYTGILNPPTVPEEWYGIKSIKRLIDDTPTDIAFELGDVFIIAKGSVMTNQTELVRSPLNFYKVDSNKTMTFTKTSVEDAFIIILN